MADIYEYTDYRRFLEDHYSEIKEKNPRFSYRSFNQKVGFKSSSSLRLVMDGKRNVSSEAIFRICRGLNLKSMEAKYFSNMVLMNQSTTHEEKDHYYREMIGSCPKNGAKTIAHSVYEVFSHWYYVAILELVRLDDFQDDPKWISKRLSPTVSCKEVKRAIEQLLSLGFLNRNGDGVLERSETMISTPDEVENLSLFKFSHQMLELAKNSLNKDPAEERDFSTLTIALSKENYRRLKSMVQEFRKMVHNTLETEEQERKVVAHLNMQLFKLTKGDL